MSQGAEKSQALFQREGKPPIGSVIPLSLQHVVAAVVGIVTPAIIIANAYGLTQADRTVMIQTSLIIAGVLTLLQATPIAGFIGSGLPVVLGTSFAFVPTIQSFGGGISSLGAIMGAEIVGGACAIVFALLFKYIHKLFPPVVTGTVVLCIGLSLYTVAVGYMAGGVGDGDFGSLKNWIVALITLVTCIFLANFTKGVLKLGSLLFGLLVGYVISVFLGMVDFYGLEQAAWFELPAFMPFQISFDPSVTATLAILFVVGAVQMVGDMTSASVGGQDRVPDDKELKGGIMSQGIISIIGAFFGGLPCATFGQNVGIVTQNKVVNRMVFILVAVILLLAGFVPKLSFLLSGIPRAVIGGATINVFATISMTGVRMLTQNGLSQRDATIAGLSVALGTGIAMSAGCLHGPDMPEWVQQVFGSSSIVITTITAIILNLVLPKSEEAKILGPVEPDTEDPEVRAQLEEIARERAQDAADASSAASAPKS